MAEIKERANIVKIEGILSENKLDYKQTTDGRDFISGDLLIEVSDTNIVPVNFFSFKIKKDGGPNKIYSNLENVITNYKSIAKHGKENADLVRVTGGKLEGNEFYNAAGNLISTFRIRSNFINKVTKEFDPQAGFQIEVFLQSLVDEIKDDVPTDRLQVLGIIPMYGGKVSVINFYATDAKGIDYMRKNYSNGDTVKLIGLIDNEIIEITKTEEMEFGEDVVTTFNRIKRELIITQGTKPYEADKALDPADIKKAMIQREVSLKEQLETAQAKASDMGTGGFANEDVPF